MPVTNPPTSILSTKAKFSVFTSTGLGGTYTRNDRIILQNFRQQLRGLGSCGAIILPKDQVNEKLTDDVTENLFVKILDTTTFTDKEYSSVGDELFIGFISSVTKDIYKGKNDDRGFCQIEEIGKYYSKLPIIWSDSVQVFNPVTSDGVAYGNKDPLLLGFEKDITKMTKVESTGEGTKFKATNGKNDRVWTLKDYLMYMAGVAGVEIKFPWQYDKEIGGTLSNSTETLYPFFTNSLEVKSYDHFNGQSFMELLESNLQEPFDWFIKFESASYPTFQIINKASTKINNVCPPAFLVAKKIDDSLTTNLNITYNSEVYDKIIYRGNNILVSGSLGIFNHDNCASMINDWSADEERTYVEGPSGIPLKYENTDVQKILIQSARAKNKNVYRQFKYKYLGQDCPIKICKKLSSNPKNPEFEQAYFYPSTNGDQVYEMVPFFPTIEFYTTSVSGSTYTVPALPNVYSSSHKTPPLLELKWSDKLPWTKKDLKEQEKPFVFAQTLAKDKDEVFNWVTYNLSAPGGGYDNCSLTNTLNGWRVDMSYPETMAYVDEEEYIFTIGSSKVDVGTTTRWNSSHISDRNPSTSNYKFKSNYKMMGATVAGFSDQKMEVTLYNPDSTSSQKVKIIEDDSLECHFVHAGTIKGITLKANQDTGYTGSREFATGYDRFQKDTFVRNDFPKLYDLAKQAANWLFQKKSSAKIELSLMKYDKVAWKLGEVIQKITDGTQIKYINTSIASIEFDLVANRIYISTDVPEMPVLKRLQQGSTNSGKGTIGISSSSKEATIEPTQKVITKDAYPTTGQIAGSVDPTPDVITLQIIGGNKVKIGNSGDTLDGITWKETIPTEIIEDDIYKTPLITTIDGLGIAYLYKNGVRQMKADGVTPKRVYVGLWRASWKAAVIQERFVISYGTISIPFASNGNGADKKATVYLGDVY